MTPEEAWRIFFPEGDGYRGDMYAEASAICGTCLVKQECLDEAVDTNDIRDGFRGGMSALDRGHYARRGVVIERKIRRKGERTCEAEGCSQKFVLNKQAPNRKFCSRACRQRMYQRRRYAADPEKFRAAQQARDEANREAKRAYVRRQHELRRRAAS